MKKFVIGILAALVIAAPAGVNAQVDDDYTQPTTTTTVPDEEEVAPPVDPTTTTTLAPTTTEGIAVQPPPDQPQRPLPSAGLSTLETSLRVGALLLIGGLGVVIVARRRRYTSPAAPAA